MKSRRVQRPVRFAGQLAHRWVVHNNTRSAAAIAFYTLFSLAPALLCAKAVGGWIVGRESAQQLTEQELTEIVGRHGGVVAHVVFEHAELSGHGIFLAALSTILLVYGASSTFYQVRAALNRIFDCPVNSLREELWHFVIGHALAALCVAGIGILLVLSLATSVLLHGIVDRLGQESVCLHPMWRFGGLVLSSLMVGIVFAVLLRFLPKRRPPWRHVALGAATAVVLFELGRLLLGLYISRSLIASAYGPSGSLVAVIVWVYYAAQLFLLGAEVTAWSWSRERVLVGQRHFL